MPSADRREHLRAGSSPAPLALETEDVTHRYGNLLALRQITLRVRAGELIAVVGESGSGKTTLLRCFNRLVKPEGTVRVQGQDVSTIDAIKLRRRIGYVPQDGGLMPHWTVHRNAALVLRLCGLPEERASEMLSLVGLPPETFGKRRPSALSGGQRQRVAIARALAARPEVLLMDEPFGALDALTRGELHAAFRQLRRDFPVTTLLVTHDLAEAASLADRIAVMYQGSIEQIGTYLDLVHAPATDYVRALVGRIGPAAPA